MKKRLTLAEERLKAYNIGTHDGYKKALVELNSSLQSQNKRQTIELATQAAALAKANASLTYSLGKIVESLK